MTRSFVVLLGTTLLVLTALAVALNEPQSTGAKGPAGGDRFFPDLASSLVDAASLEVRRANSDFTLIRAKDGWRNQGLGGYPANGPKVDATLATLASLTRIAPRTAQPRLYAKLGVEDVEATATSTRLTVKAASGKVLADAIVGQPRRAGSGERHGGVYVRLSGTQRAWLANGSFDVHLDAPGWSDRRLVDIDADDIESIVIRHPGDPPIEIERKASPQGPFGLAGLPSGLQVRHPFQIRYLSGLFNDLTLLNARPANRSTDQTDDFGANTTMVVVKSRQGLVVTLQALLDDSSDEVWATLDAEAARGARLSSAASKEVARLRKALPDWAFLLPRAASERLRIRLADIIGAAAPPATN